MFLTQNCISVVYSTTEKYMEEYICKSLVIKIHYNVLLRFSSETFAVLMYTPLKWRIFSSPIQLLFYIFNQYEVLKNFIFDKKN